MRCTVCQAELPQETRVCTACGSPVTFNPTLEDLYFSRLIASTPQKLVQKVRATPHLVKERRTVTALLLTVANAEEFTEKIPETERVPLLNTALDLIAGVIYQFEGSLAKLWENTVLAFFGAPITHEDDPIRAVYAAQAIRTEIQAHSKEIEKAFGVPMRLHMVLNTGPILIGEIKSNLKYSFQSLGSTLECMDSATRLDIPFCEIILFEDTFQSVKPFVQCTPLDDLPCQEATSSIPLWRVDTVYHPDRAVSRMPITQSTSLIGRQSELNVLLDLSETVLAGLGRVGLILGEAGIGKSRLILEWKQKLKSLRQPTRIRWIEAHGQSFGRELAYHMLKSLLRAALGLSEDVPNEQLEAVLQETLTDLLGADQESLYPYLAHLLDLQLTDELEAKIHQLNTQDLRVHYLDAVKQFLRAITLEQPVILILEDLQWGDESSIDLLADLLPITATSPILFCLVSRPDRDSDGWRLVMAARETINARRAEIRMQNLDAPESQRLIEELLEAEDIPESILNLVLEKSEGNPYFIEELIRSLVNEGVLIKKEDRWWAKEGMDPNRVPDSLQGLLAARIDRLPPDARFTLRVASVIGRSFPEGVIEKVLADRSPDIELMSQLSTLESIGMIRVAQIRPELTYSFQHILLHDAAYHSIVDEDRKALHLSVGYALETVYPDQQQRLASQLAEHFLKGGKPETALAYFDTAGHVSLDSFANAEAEHFFTAALQITQQPDRLASLYSNLGEALAQQGKHREAIQAWNKAIVHCNNLGHFDRLARVYARSARSAWWGYDSKHGLEICLKGMAAVKNAAESPDIAYLVHETGRAYLFNDLPDDAREYCVHALEMGKRLQAFDVQAEALATIGILPTISPEEAVAVLEEAIQISETHNLYGPAFRAYVNLAIVVDKLGKVRLARDYRKRALELGNKTSGPSNGGFIEQAITRASLWLADFADAEIQINRMRELTQQSDSTLSENTLDTLYLEGVYRRLMGDFSGAIERFTDLANRSRQINDLTRLRLANRSMAEIILEGHLLEDDKRAASNLEIAFDMLTENFSSENGNPDHKDVLDYTLLSVTHALKGNILLAQEALDKANQLYQKQPAMQALVEIKLAQARLALAQKDYNSAFSSLTEAAEMLDKMEARWWRSRTWLEIAVIYLQRNEPEDIDQAHNIFRETLADFKDIGVGYYPDLIIDKLRQVKSITRAQAIAHKKITKELAEAGRVQHTIIPASAPEIPGFQISGALIPAHETSGDFYDFIPLEGGRLGIVIADVGDKGAGAALYMAMSRTLFRTYAGEGERSPVDVITEVNRRILSDTERGIFLTAVYGILDPRKSTFEYVNAGHNPPCFLHVKSDEVVCSQLEKTGSLLGIFIESQWKTGTIEFSKGDSLVLYTDGITESQDEKDIFFGNDRLQTVLLSNFDQPAEAFRNSILENVQSFIKTAPRLDDITLIIVRKE